MHNDDALVWLTALNQGSKLSALTSWVTKVPLPPEWADEMFRWSRYAVVRHAVVTGGANLPSLVPPPPTSCGLAAFLTRLSGLVRALEWWHIIVHGPSTTTREAVAAHGLLHRLRQTDDATGADFAVLTQHPPAAASTPCPVLRAADALCADVWVRSHTSAEHHALFSSSSGQAPLCHNLATAATLHGGHNINTYGLRVVFLAVTADGT